MAVDQGDRLRAIAAVLASNPSMSYQQLAAASGISRRTLYRIAPTREALFALLHDAAVEANRIAMTRADLDQTHVVDALLMLTRDYVADADLYSFWMADSWTKPVKFVEDVPGETELQAYRGVMLTLFERGQRDGIFRQDVPLTWLIYVYDAMLNATTSARRAGMADEEISQRIVENFLYGAAPR